MTPGDPPVHPSPPSLRRLGPDSVELTDSRGRPARTVGRMVRVRSGSRLLVTVVPPRPNPDGPPAEVKFAAGDSLAVVVEPSKTVTGRGTEYHLVLRGRLGGRLPLPTRSELTLTIIDGTTKPFVMHIPIGVMPSIGTLIGWGLLGVLVPLVSYRYVKLVGDSGNPFAAGLAILTDPLFLSQSTALSAAATLLLMIFGRVLLQFGPADGDAE